MRQESQQQKYQYHHSSQAAIANRHNTNDMIAGMPGRVDGKIHVELRYCTVCNIEQPLRSKHCRNCNRCISTYDHHCPWMGNCVGERNRKYFYWFIVSQEC